MIKRTTRKKWWWGGGVKKAVKGRKVMENEGESGVENENLIKFLQILFY